MVSIIQLLLSKKGLKGNLSIERFWTASHDKALETLKQMLLQNQVLLYPDIAKPFILYTDASKYYMSSVLMQYDDKGQLVPLGYWSKSFKGTQVHWSALVKEARAVLEAMQHFQVFMKGCPIELRCNHKPLA